MYEWVVRVGCGSSGRVGVIGSSRVGGWGGVEERGEVLMLGYAVEGENGGIVDKVYRE